MLRNVSDRVKKEFRYFQPFLADWPPGRSYIVVRTPLSPSIMGRKFFCVFLSLYIAVMGEGWEQEKLVMRASIIDHG
jgi:hypothetical protein